MFSKCLLGALCFFIDGTCMATLPRLAIDNDLGKEPEALANLHSTREKLGYRCFMPKNEEEMDMILAKKDDLDFIISFWRNLEFDIQGEISARLTDGVVKFVKRYADHLCNFIAMTDMPKYQPISDLLFHNPKCGYSDFIIVLGGVFQSCYYSQVKSDRQRILHRYIVMRAHEAFVNYHGYERAAGVEQDAHVLSFLDGYNFYVEGEIPDEFQRIHGEITEAVLSELCDNSLTLPIPHNE